MEAEADEGDHQCEPGIHQVVPEGDLAQPCFPLATLLVTQVPSDLEAQTMVIGDAPH